MLPDPLHPAVVHFPIVLAVLLPISAVVALWAIRRGAGRLQAWSVPLVLALALTATGWFATETGEAEEERVESVVAEQVLHEHEEAAERFLVFGGVTTLLLAGGLLAGTVGAAARIVGTAATLAVLAAGVQVGEAGGELVYRHGAASAYVGGNVASGSAEAALDGGEAGEHEEDEDEH